MVNPHPPSRSREKFWVHTNSGHFIKPAVSRILNKNFKQHIITRPDLAEDRDRWQEFVNAVMNL